MSQPQIDLNEEKGRLRKAPAFLQYTAARGRVKGHFEINGPLLPGQVAEGDTLMCTHCQKHWRLKPGSGMQRGWCGRCGGPTCGKQKCETSCVPFEKAIELMESKNKLRDTVRSMFGFGKGLKT